MESGVYGRVYTGGCTWDMYSRYHSLHTSTARYHLLHTSTARGTPADMHHLPVVSSPLARVRHCLVTLCPRVLPDVKVVVLPDVKVAVLPDVK